MKKEESVDNFNISDAFKSIDKINPYATFLDDGTLSSVDKFIDSGSYALNAILSGKIKNGGYPVGRITMLAGPSQTGKSFLVQKAIKAAQEKGLHVIVFDSENAIDPESAKRLGIDTSKVKYVPTNTVEECRNTISTFLNKLVEAKQKEKVMIVIDSLGNLESEMQVKRMDNNNVSADMGSMAKACKSLLKTLTRLAAFTRTPVLITNHIYDDPSSMYPSLVKSMPGGRSAVYLPTVTLQLGQRPIKPGDGRDEDQLAGERHKVGSILTALTVKNRIIQPDLKTELYLTFKNGLDKYHGLMDIAIDLGVIKREGLTYYTASNEKLGKRGDIEGNNALWEKLIPEIQNKIDEMWQYSQFTETNLTEEELDVSDTSRTE